MKLHLRPSSLWALAFAIASSVGAQCTTQWLPGSGYNGVYGRVYALAKWDPDGPGPQPTRLVAAGSFRYAGTVATRNIVSFDPASGTWSPLGTGTNATVRCLLALPDGGLVAGGDFTEADGVMCNHVVRWNGTTWAPLGSGVTATGYNPSVRSIATLPNGDIVIGGRDFTGDGGATCHRIGRWDGTTWHAMGSGMEDAVDALVALPNGDLVAGGQFSTAGGVACSRIARWNGTSWSPIGSGIGTVGGSYVKSLCTMPNGDLVVGGYFFSAGGVTCNRIARWNGSIWTPLGTGTNGDVVSMTPLPNGDLIVGGSMTSAGGVSVANIARWDGAAWSRLGTGVNNTVECLTVLPNGDLFAGGFLGSAGSLPLNGVARWTDQSWTPVASGFAEYVAGPDSCPRALAPLPNGDVLAGLTHVTADGVVATNIARWDHTNWYTLGSGLNGRLRSMLPLPNGEVLVGGEFTVAGGTSCNRVARWDGTTWSPLGSGLGYEGVYALARLPNGNIVAGGTFTSTGTQQANRIAMWDGTSWAPLGQGFNDSVRALAVLPNGDLVAGGIFTTADGAPAAHIARWDGSTWSPVGSGCDGPVFALHILPNGDMVVGGRFTVAGGVTANCVARRDATGWYGMGAGMSGGTTLWPTTVYAFALLRTGELVAGGQFPAADGLPCNHVARWDGASWSGIGTGITGYPGTTISSSTTNSPQVYALEVLPSGDLVAGGAFTQAGDVPSFYVARWATSCPADVTVLPSNCVGPAGALTLTAEAPPFVGTVYRATTIGYAGNAVAITLLGLNPPGVWLPLLSRPSCRLLTWSVPVDIQVPSNGVGEWEAQVPTSPSLAGLVLYQQSVQITPPRPFHPPVSNSNALRLTIGSY